MDKNLDSLIISYRTCSDEKKKRLLHISIVESGMDIVKKISRNTPYKSASLNYEDIFQAGTIGLLRAIDTFDENSDANFTTYANHLIKGEIMHCLRDRGDTLNSISLDAKSDDDLSIADTISDDNTNESLYDDKIMIVDEIEKLPDNLKKIIKMNFFDEMSQKEIAEVMNSSAMYISRMIKKALNTMYNSIMGNDK